MSSSRMHNFSGAITPPPPPPPPPTPVPPTGLAVISQVQALDESAFVAWDYKASDANTLTKCVVTAKDTGNPTNYTVLVPDTDFIISGLKNGVTYTVTVTPYNKDGAGKPSVSKTVTPAAPLIPTPVLVTAVAGDGGANVTWTLAAMPDGYALDWVSYEAKRTDTGETITEHVDGKDGTGKITLENDVTWEFGLVAIGSKDGKQFLSDISNRMTVSPEKPLAPYKPTITGAQVDAGNAGTITVNWVNGTNKRNSPLTVLEWELKLDGVTIPITDGAARTYTTAKVVIGLHTLQVRGRNDIGWSEWSTEVGVNYSPTEKRPFTSDKAFSDMDTDAYHYAIFNPGNSPQAGWDSVWNCTRTTAGDGLEFEVLLVGSGGGGKGQTVTLAKGGDGGGGELVIGKIAPGAAGTKFSVNASIGGVTNIDSKPSVITDGTNVLTARNGKSASSNANADGYPKTEVPKDWQDCSAFKWLLPDSVFVGGVSEATQQNYPNGTFDGQGGAGTKSGKPGQGMNGIVVVRWAR